MTEPDITAPDGGREPLFMPWLEAVTGRVAISGGLLALAVAGLVTISVLGRWMFSSPIDGDFEFVKMATAVAVFAYLPFAQARRGNIMVDTFTLRFSLRARAALDAFWDMCYAAFALFCALALSTGAMEALKSGETTMQRQIVVWPSIALSALLCFLLALTTVITAVRVYSSWRKWP